MIVMNADKGRFQLDPRSKIITLTFVCIISMSGSYEGLKFFPRLAICLLPVLLLLVSKKTKIAFIFSLLLFVSAWMEGFVNQQFQGAFGLLLVIISGLVSRFLPSMIMGYYFIRTTGVEELIAALQKSHLPNVFTIPMAVMFRFFPTIAQESASINDAMRLRGIGASNAIKNPIRFLEYRFVPLMSSIVKIGDELSAAALTRGLDVDGQRTSYCQVKLRLLDYVWMLLLFSLVIFYHLVP